MCISFFLIPRKKEGNLSTSGRRRHYQTNAAFGREFPRCNRIHGMAHTQLHQPIAKTGDNSPLQSGFAYLHHKLCIRKGAYFMCAVLGPKVAVVFNYFLLHVAFPFHFARPTDQFLRDLCSERMVLVSSILFSYSICIQINIQ